MADTEQKTVWTVGRLLDWTTTHFQQKNVEGGRLATELLLPGRPQTFFHREVIGNEI